MPSKKLPCPTCSGLMSPTASRCRKCKPTYDRTPEHRSKMSQVVKGIPKPTLQGKRRPEHSRALKEWWTPERREEARKRGNALAEDTAWRLRIAKALTGDKNPNWQGGLTQECYAPGFSKTLKQRIRERDGFTCQLCAATEDELQYTLTVHHSDYDKSNHSEENLFAVCKRCNSLANTNRAVWEGYFRALGEMRQKYGREADKFVRRTVVSQRVGLIYRSHDGDPDLSELFPPELFE